MITQETSRAAYEAFIPYAAIADDKVLAALRASDGCTDEEGEALTGLKHQTYTAQRRHLVEAGRVVNTGRRKKASSGHSVIIWGLA